MLNQNTETSKRDARPYVYAHEMAGAWSLVYQSGDQAETLLTGIERQQAIQVVAAQRQPGGPVHCGQPMEMRRGKYVCRVCGIEY